MKKLHIMKTVYDEDIACNEDTAYTAEPAIATTFIQYYPYIKVLKGPAKFVYYIEGLS